MKQSEKAKAILHIRPNAQFVLRELEIEWLDETQTQPSEQEIEAGWVAYQAAQVAEAEAKAEAKVAAQTKLAALGLTVSDLEALGL
jgi:hypothetical protein